MRFVFFLLTGVIKNGYEHWFGGQFTSVGLFILYEIGYLVFFLAFSYNSFHLFFEYLNMVEDDIDTCTLFTGFPFLLLIVLEFIGQIICWILQGTLSINSVNILNTVFDIWHIVLFVVCIVYLLNSGIRSLIYASQNSVIFLAKLSLPSILFFAFYIVFAILDIAKVFLGDYFIWFGIVGFICEAVPALCLYFDFFEFIYKFDCAFAPTPHFLKAYRRANGHEYPH